jgi:lysozyme family protein
VKIEEVSNLAENIDNKILSLVDIKIENDMKEVISEIRRLEDKQDIKYNAIESKISMIMWAIGILIALIVSFKFFN